MRDYEFTVIFGTNEDLTEKGLEFVTKTFEAAGVQVAKQEDLGVKTLAYKIQKQDKGHYYFFEVSADSQSINKMTAEFNLEDSILKSLFVAK